MESFECRSFSFSPSGYLSSYPPILNSYTCQKYHVSVPEASKTVDVELDIKVADAGTERAALLRQPDAALGKVIENKLLTVGLEPQKRHLGGFFLSAYLYVRPIPTQCCQFPMVANPTPYIRP